MVVYSFSLYGPPVDTHEFASPLCSHSRRVRTRLLKVALLHRPGGQLALLKVAVYTPGEEAASRYRLFVSFYVAWTYDLALCWTTTRDIYIYIYCDGYCHG